MFVEIIECKKLDAGRVLSDFNNVVARKVKRTPASFPPALIADRWTFIGAADWRVLTLMIAPG